MKEFLKNIAYTASWLATWPGGKLAVVMARIFDSWKVFEHLAQWYSGFPGVFGRYMRGAFYAHTLRRSGRTAQYGYGSVISKMDTSIGDGVYIGLYSSIGYAEIGDDTVIANYVSVLSGQNQHNLSDPDRPILSGNDTFDLVRVGRNTFIGDKATIMSDVGDCCVIGAGAVVTSPIPGYSIAVGVPARAVKDRTPPQ